MEVGPGKGALTRPLLARGLKVLAVEVDAVLAARLREGLDGEDLRVVEADALAFDHAAARRLFDVPPGDFSPRPKVVSTVVELVPGVPPEDAAAAIAVASAGFGVRRKTLVNGLTAAWGREAASAAVASAGLLPTVRAEELPPEGFLALARRLGPRPAAAGTR